MTRNLAELRQRVRAAQSWRIACILAAGTCAAETIVLAALGAPWRVVTAGAVGTISGALSACFWHTEIDVRALDLRRAEARRT